MQWLNEPDQWQAAGHMLTVTANPRTDAWRLTHDGAIRDTAHFYYRTVLGDFEATVTVSGQYAALYDQAGLMVRENEETWLKCGIEVVDGQQQVSAVLTRDYSDWSVRPLEAPPTFLRLRVTRRRGTVEVYYTLPDQEGESLLRQGYLTETEALMVGMMCAAPTGNGFPATFEGFTVRSL